jgi:plasmid replication initiation protein
MSETQRFLQTNAITQARYDYSVTEKRLIFIALMEVEKAVKEGLPDNFFEKELTLLIPEVLMKRFDSADHRFRDYRKAVASLRAKTFSIDLPDGWVETGFLNGGRYFAGKGLEVKISSYVLPYLHDLSKCFTVLEATVLMTLQSKFSQRFYEFCSQWRAAGKFDFTPQKLNDILCLKLPTAQLKRDVIDIAKAELIAMYEQGISDIYFTYTEERGGRGRGGSVKKWNFQIHTKKKKQEKEKAQNGDVILVVTMLSELFDSQTVDKAVEAIGNHENMKEFADRMEKLRNSPRWSQIKNKPGYIRSILQNEYGLDETETT